MASGQFFASTSWDPWLIISQIIFNQCAFYAVVAALLFVFSLVSGGDVSLLQLLDFKAMDSTNAHGWIPMVAFGFSSIPL